MARDVEEGVSMTEIVVTAADLERGAAAFKRWEGRDSMYRVATFLLDRWWGRHAEMADALTVLLLTWNQAFYRYGRFEPELLADCLAKRWREIDGFRHRTIMGLAKDDHAAIRDLFNNLLLALATSRGRSPVAVAKAMHLLAPGFFPIWDAAIAKAYGCGYHRDPSDAYLKFCEKTERIARSLVSIAPDPSKTLLKSIDEYNYARFSKAWID
jgi:hypothetical protein